ncbi:MFS transporter [Emcibacter nanhaiensis]|uniref:MFS transporter n=1 Tax=Emcibacter nanhaiensis TaxID=1505037 RepID=A0A501PJJ9_9PROT|nr:MFS transporter [Emcibacter nanhaiensis]TPD60202.1 MFS transporter [Emcibacter nanhaiensis]
MSADITSTNENSPNSFDIAALIDARKFNGFNYRLILLSWLITIFDGLDMMMISYTAPYIAEDLDLTKAMLGNVFSSGLLGMMLGGFFFAYLGDRIGRRITVIISAFIFGILTTVTAFVSSYPELVAIRFLDGFAIGGMLPLAWALNIEYVPKRLRSTTITIIMMGYSLGTALAGPLTNMLAPGFGWGSVFVAGGLGTIVCAALLLFNLPESVRFLVSRNLRPDLVVKTLKKLEPQIELPKVPVFILSDEPVYTTRFHIRQLFEGRLALLTPILWIGYIASTLAIYLIASWGPIVLEQIDVGRQTAAWASSISSVLGAVAGLSLMRFTDKKGPFSVAVFPLIAIPILLVLGLVPMAQSSFLIINVIATALVAGGHYGILSIAGVFYPSAIRANGAGWATSIAKFGGIAGPLLGGLFLASALPVVHIFSLLAICPAILALCAIGIGLVTRELRETNNQEILLKTE